MHEDRHVKHCTCNYLVTSDISTNYFECIKQYQEMPYYCLYDGFKRFSMIDKGNVILSSSYALTIQQTHFIVPVSILRS